MKFKINDTASIVKTFSAEEVANFGKISGDLNPVHMDEEYAAKTIFKKRVCHGMLVASLFSAILGTTLPGEGSIYLGQDLKFTKPVYIGDEVTATVTIVEIIKEKKRIILQTEAFNQDNELVIVGKATILFPKLEEN